MCIIYMHTSRRPDTKWLHKYTFSNSHTRHYISDRLTDSRTLMHSSLLQSVTLTLRDTRTHWQIDTTINIVLCSLIHQLGLVNDRLTTISVSDCLFDSIPYNKLYEWIHRLLLLFLTLPSSTLRGYMMTIPSSLVIHFVLCYRRVCVCMCMCVCVSVSLCVCRVCGPHENVLR